MKCTSCGRDRAVVNGICDDCALSICKDITFFKKEYNGEFINKGDDDERKN